MDKRTESLCRALADYMQTEGCTCCESIDEHDKARSVLAGLLSVPMYDDASGYDFNQFATNPVEVGG